VNTQAKQEWPNSEILDLMEQRRKCRRETQQYKQLEKKSFAVNTQISEAKTKFYNAQCVQLEKLERSNPQLMQDKVKKITAGKKSYCS